MVKLLRENSLLLFFLAIMTAVSIAMPEYIARYPEMVEWRTIMALAGLLVITTAIRESNYFHHIAHDVVKHVKTERGIAIFIIFFSAFLSTFLTNDVALFITIPLLIEFSRVIKNELTKIAIFSAIAVNSASLLTPIGNPQNLFIWHRWGISFISFIVQMFPLFLLMMALLLVTTFISFPPAMLRIQEKIAEKYDRRLFSISLILLIFFIVLIQYNMEEYAILPIIIFYAVLYPSTIKNTDWLLIALFIIMFIDFSMLEIFLSAFISFPSSNGSIFLLSAMLSQVMSNVPSAIFVSNFSSNWKMILYGVNVGGNGVIIASMANIIAMRLMKNRKAWMDFHKYSIPFLLISTLLAFILIESGLW